MNRYFNQFDNGYPYTSYDQSYRTNNSFVQNQYQPQFQTNKIFVLGPEEALMRTTQNNCLAVYFNQNKPELYEVRVDNEGRKKIDTYYLHNNQQNSNNDFEMRLKRIEDLIFKPVEPVKESVNEQSNGVR